MRPQRVKVGRRVRAAAIILLRAVIFGGLLASILFAHGCHGDEDHELFGAAVQRLVE